MTMLTYLWYMIQNIDFYHVLMSKPPVCVLQVPYLAGFSLCILRGYSSSLLVLCTLSSPCTPFEILHSLSQTTKLTYLLVMKPHLYTNVPDYYAIIDDYAHHEHLIRSRKMYMLTLTSTCTTVGSLKGGCVYTNGQPLLQLNCYVVCTTVHCIPYSG